MVITDEGFRLPSISAKAAVETAEKLLEWCSQPEISNEFELFATNLIEELDRLQSSSPQSSEKTGSHVEEPL